MKAKSLSIALAAAIAVPAAILAVIATASDGGALNQRPDGPCDVYAAGGSPCVAAHSSTRALYKDYNGPLYQIMRQSDGKTLDIGVVQANAKDGGGYADAAAQDEFCADTYCWVTILYDQSGHGNDLYQAPRGGFSGPAMGGFNNIPLADWAPVTLMGHKVYGLFIAPGMGLRWNDATGTAVDDQAEGQYWVISGHHFNGGCCFDYGNAETDSRDDGDGTMETTYYGNSRGWYYGSGQGPWIMTDQENNLVGCVNPDPNDKFCRTLESISWRFVTATADGEPHHWRSMGGNAQEGELSMFYDGGRIQNDRNSYDPMRKQGAILLGNGGDNSNGSAGTFYEAAMTAAGTFPTVETNQKIQANVVAAGYDVARLTISSTAGTDNPGGLQTFSPKSTQHTVVTFVNTTGKPIDDLAISLVTPRGWKAVVSGTKDKVRKIGYTVEPGQRVVVDFTVTSSRKLVNCDLKAKADWSAAGGRQSWTAVQKVRNVPAVTINEFRVSDGNGNRTNSFIELYNASEKAVNISGWNLTQHAINIPYFSTITVPAGTKIPAKGFYLMGLSNSGLAVDAAKGDKTIYVRDITGIKEGHSLVIGTGRNAEKASVAKVTARLSNVQDENPRNRFVPGMPTTIWQPLPEGPIITIPAGSTSIPVTSVAGFEPGMKVAIGYGAEFPAVSNKQEKYEVVTITSVGKPGTQAWLAMDAKKGDTNIKMSSTENISVGDVIRLDINSVGHGIETVKVKAVGTPSVRNTLGGPLKPGEDPGTGIDLEEPLKFDHSSNMPYSVNGTGISFEPATKFDHSSNEPVLALVYEIELTSALTKNHAIDDVVLDAAVTTSGYQGDVPADLLFGGPALSETKGNMTLRTRKGLIVDALNWGGIVDPWLGEGYQGQSNEDGNFAPTPVVTQGRNRFATPMPPAVAPELSTGRYPDGTDSDDNKADFRTQKHVNLASEAAAGSNNVKVNSVAGIRIGQYMYLGAGETAERVMVTVIGTPGATTLASSVPAGTSVIPVTSGRNFTLGQEVFVNGQKTTVTAIELAPRFRFGQTPAQTPVDKITLGTALKAAAPAGAPVAGTGLDFAKPLASGHAAGEALVSGRPTPGAPNRF